jgi:hypothetical protein
MKTFKLIFRVQDIGRKVENYEKCDILKRLQKQMRIFLGSVSPQFAHILTQNVMLIFPSVSLNS